VDFRSAFCLSLRACRRLTLDTRYLGPLGCTAGVGRRREEVELVLLWRVLRVLPEADDALGGFAAGRRGGVTSITSAVVRDSAVGLSASPVEARLGVWSVEGEGVSTGEGIMDRVV
jgi:hypothetical protein